ncbi:hypothetical protein VCHA53O466_140062 [Vibrio chagasii]|nr:hypothetical protein VCHA53O466_140062 [Vibrio chagasii]
MTHTFEEKVILLSLVAGKAIVTFKPTPVVGDEDTLRVELLIQEPVSKLTRSFGMFVDYNFAAKHLEALDDLTSIGAENCGKCEQMLITDHDGTTYHVDKDTYLLSSKLDKDHLAVKVKHCHECGEEFYTSPSGINYHESNDSTDGHDLDADHTPFSLEDA